MILFHQVQYSNIREIAVIPTHAERDQSIRGSSCALESQVFLETFFSHTYRSKRPKKNVRSRILIARFHRLIRG